MCRGAGYEVLVCNPNQEAWKWKHVKRKTDRDDALKLAKLAALDQLVPVYVPCQGQREYRRLVKYRRTLVGRSTRVQNNIRWIFAQHGLSLPRGQKAWSLEGLAQIAEHRQPLTNCSSSELWRGELDLELTEFEQRVRVTTFPGVSHERPSRDKAELPYRHGSRRGCAVRDHHRRTGPC
jgi:transposase